MQPILNILVTGGAGFIGSALCRHLVAAQCYRVVNVDKMTYAGNLLSLADIDKDPNYSFVKADISDRACIKTILSKYSIDVIIHLAAESHVDRSIDGPSVFIETNIIGTFNLLEEALVYWRSLDSAAQRRFRFHHVSTDEVFGDLPFEGGLFNENTPYNPSSPYSASKAAADHLVHAWHQTFGLPVVSSNCSNNYGPYHFPEKLIPLVILNALDRKPLPVYGTGSNVRDWLYVDDHAKALERVMRDGRVGENYLIGGRAERTNLAVVEAICSLLDQKAPRLDGRSYCEQINFVADRPGHDRRYAIDPTKMENELSWRPGETFETGLSKTIDWYLDREDWWRPLRHKKYAGERLGHTVLINQSADSNPPVGETAL